MPEEKDLIEGIIKNDERSCERILNLYKGRIFSYILRLVRNYDDAEELTFETFIKFFKSVKSYDPSKPLSNWLFKIAHNQVIDFFRKNKIKYEYLDEGQPSGEDFLKEYEMAKRMKEIEEAISHLPPLDREILLLFHKEEYSYEEISRILNLPVSTIKTRLHRARRRLKEMLKR
uniref:RNA polymerase sigma factor n=1 Tax=candidate division WOR-3 bacterium TaxID=2052148 RepID=A0A7C4THC2_UNCW3